MFPLKIVIFRSCVGLPEGTYCVNYVSTCPTLAFTAKRASACPLAAARCMQVRPRISWINLGRALSESFGSPSYIFVLQLDLTYLTYVYVYFFYLNKFKYELYKYTYVCIEMMLYILYILRYGKYDIYNMFNHLLLDEENKDHFIQIFHV